MDLKQNIDVYSRTVYCFLSKHNPIYQLINPPQYNESVVNILNSIPPCSLTLSTPSASSEILSESILNSQWNNEVENWIEFLNSKFNCKISLDIVLANLIEFENSKADVHAY